VWWWRYSLLQVLMTLILHVQPWDCIFLIVIMQIVKEFGDGAVSTPVKFLSLSFEWFVFFRYFFKSLLLIFAFAFFVSKIEWYRQLSNSYRERGTKVPSLGNSLLSLSLTHAQLFVLLVPNTGLQVLLIFFFCVIFQLTILSIHAHTNSWIHVLMELSHNLWDTSRRGNLLCFSKHRTFFCSSRNEW
jgi:hypothetical protein